MIESFIDWAEHSYHHDMLQPVYNFILYDVHGCVLCRPIFDNDTGDFY